MGSNRGSKVTRWGTITPTTVDLSGRVPLRYFFTDFPIGEEELYHLNEVRRRIPGVLNVKFSDQPGSSFLLSFRKAASNDDVRQLTAIFLDNLVLHVDALFAQRDARRLVIDHTVQTTPRRDDPVFDTLAACGD